MDGFNVLMILLFSAIALYAVARRRQFPLGDKTLDVLNQKQFEWVFVVGVVLFGAFLRLYRLGTLPAGFNQDEASIGYDSWAIANYGMDRNGDILPVYPIAWGAGHGPLYTYTAAVFIKLFGLTPFVYRLPNALMGVASLPIFYLLLKRVWGRVAGYVGLAFFALTPWHIMLSRWGLDSNPLPFMLLLGAYWLVLAADTYKTRWYLLAAAALSLSMYAYGSALVVVPVMLLLLLPYLLLHRRLNWKQLLLSGLTFALLALPLGLFYIINYFDLPEISTSFFTIPRLTVIRSESVFLKFDHTFWSNVLQNIQSLIRVLTTGSPDLIWNVVPDFYTVYVFTFPLMFIGMIRSFRRAVNFREFSRETVMCAWFLGAVLLALLIKQNINRLSVLFIPQVYFITLGLVYLVQHFRQAFALASAAVIGAAAMFCTYYFTVYNDDISASFMEGFGEAVQYADSLESETMYVTAKGVNGGYILTLFFVQTPPQDFVNTVVYYDENAEFRQAASYGKYVFHLPADAVSPAHQDDVFVVNTAELGQFSLETYDIRLFKNFAVVQYHGE